MVYAVQRALTGYENKEGWSILVERALKSDNSWGRSANEYIRLYKQLLKIMEKTLFESSDSVFFIIKHTIHFCHSYGRSNQNTDILVISKI